MTVYDDGSLRYLRLVFEAHSRDMINSDKEKTMDPQATLRDFLQAIIDRDKEAAREHAETINGWVMGGGFDPDYSRAVWEAFDALIEE